MMQNVIAFPKMAAPAPARVSTGGATTLFVHIRRSTLIVHLAAPRSAIADASIAGHRS